MKKYGRRNQTITSSSFDIQTFIIVLRLMVISNRNMPASKHQPLTPLQKYRKKNKIFQLFIQYFYFAHGIFHFFFCWCCCCRSRCCFSFPRTKRKTRRKKNILVSFLVCYFPKNGIFSIINVRSRTLAHTHQTKTIQGIYYPEEPAKDNIRSRFAKKKQYTNMCYI